MTLAQNKRKTRKDTFRKIGEAISRAAQPTPFNPHYNIAGRADRHVTGNNERLIRDFL